jgi:hypothetical protein
MSNTGNSSSFSKLTHPRKNEKALLPHPDPSVMVVNTNDAGFLLGVKSNRAMQMPIDARTGRHISFHLPKPVNAKSKSDAPLIGANQRIIP